MPVVSTIGYRETPWYRSTHTYFVAAGIILLIALPSLVSPIILMRLLCYALFAAAFNLLFGYVGLLSFGHAAFFGGAAYVTAYAVKYMGTTPEIAMLLGVAIAAVLGLVFGLISIRRKGIYFAMITLALAQMFFYFCLKIPVTGGEDGMQGIHRGRLFGIVDLSDNIPLYYFVLAIFLGASFAIWRIINSPFGSILKAIRENENRVVSLGYRVQRYKLAAFVMSAAITGLAGATKVLVFQFATLSDVAWHMSGDAIMMTLLGGVGTLLGPLAGAAIYISLQNLVATTGLPGSIVTGLTFIFCILVLKRGIVGELQRVGAFVRGTASAKTS
jgi:branched-chain amino acid transport system permease protein